MFKIEKNSTRKGFEPSRAEHNCLAGNRLNHSATASYNNQIDITIFYIKIIQIHRRTRENLIQKFNL